MGQPAAAPAAGPGTSSAPAAAVEATAYNSLSIVQPANETSYFDADAVVDVQISSDPPTGGRGQAPPVPRREAGRELRRRAELLAAERRAGSALAHGRDLRCAGQGEDPQPAGRVLHEAEHDQFAGRGRTGGEAEAAPSRRRSPAASRTAPRRAPPQGAREVAADPRNVYHPTQAELCGLLDGVATSLIWLDSAGAVLHLNEPAEDLFGLSRNQAAGRSIRELLKANVELDGVIGRALAADAQYSRRELPFEAGPGAAPRTLDVTVTPFDQPGHPGRRRRGTRRRHAAPAHRARERTAHAARRQPRDGPAARARDQESARRTARRGAAARAAIEGPGAARIHDGDHQRGRPPGRAGGRAARSRPAAAQGARQHPRARAARRSPARGGGADRRGHRARLRSRACRGSGSTATR